MRFFFLLLFDGERYLIYSLTWPYSNDIDKTTLWTSQHFNRMNLYTYYILNFEMKYSFSDVVNLVPRYSWLRFVFGLYINKCQSITSIKCVRCGRIFTNATIFIDQCGVCGFVDMAFNSYRWFCNSDEKFNDHFFFKKNHHPLTSMSIICVHTTLSDRNCGVCHFLANVCFWCVCVCVYFFPSKLSAYT